MFYTMAVNAAQLTVICAALELYERVGMGQFTYVAEVVAAPTPALADEAEDAFRAAKRATFPELAPGAYHAIRSPAVADSFRVAYDLDQVIRYRMHHDRGGPEWSTWAATPWASSAEPLAVIASMS
jgi:hypothetical protein